MDKERVIGKLVEMREEERSTSLLLNSESSFARSDGYIKAIDDVIVMISRYQPIRKFLGFECPHCHGYSILSERTPNGDSACKGCGYSGPSKEFRVWDIEGVKKVGEE